MEVNRDQGSNKEAQVNIDPFTGLKRATPVGIPEELLVSKSFLKDLLNNHELAQGARAYLCGTYSDQEIYCSDRRIDKKGTEHCLVLKGDGWYLRSDNGNGTTWWPLILTWDKTVKNLGITTSEVLNKLQEAADSFQKARERKRAAGGKDLS